MEFAVLGSMARGELNREDQTPNTISETGHFEKNSSYNQPFQLQLTRAGDDERPAHYNPTFDTDLLNSGGLAILNPGRLSPGATRNSRGSGGTVVQGETDGETDSADKEPVENVADVKVVKSKEISGNRQKFADSRVQDAANGEDMPRISPGRKEWYTIQLISLSDKNRAQQFVDQIALSEEKIQIWTHKTEDGSTFYRVRLGVLDSRPEARKYAQRLAENGKIEKDYWISKVYR